ncbi:MAG TPA: GAF domain-containing sensor histidine kinase [Abditibacteriaceae bacterium]|jgi:signal transduction histidine kinase
MKLFTPRRWSIAWRVRLGLLIVPCVLVLLVWYQFRVANETVERYRSVVAGTDELINAVTQMRQSAQSMENAARGLHSWIAANASSADADVKSDVEKTYILPYNAAKTQFTEGYQTAIAQAPADSALEKHINTFYDAGSDWQREIAEPLVTALRDPQPLDARKTWRPFDEAESGFNRARDAILEYRRARLSGADQFRWFSTWNLLALEGAAIVLAIIIGIGLSRAVTTPLYNVVAQSRRIESGDYSQFAVISADEFGEVTHAMNAMAMAIAARLEHEKLSGRLTAAVTRSLDPATVLQTTARELGEALQVSRCILCLTGETPLWFQWNSPGIAPLESSPCQADAYPQRVLQNAQTLAFSDIENEMDLVEELKGQGVRALLTTPLLLRGQSAGVIALHQCSTPRQWSNAEIALLERAGAQVAIALDNARLFHQSQERAAQLQAARDALTQSGAQLQEKNRELEEFVYTVSHDLKAPLISIQGYLKAMNKDFAAELPKDAGFYIERIHKNAAQLESLIGDLIELSRIGRVRENWEEANTYELAREAATELTLQAQAKAVQIEIASDLPVLFCEKKRLRQVFLNLLENAIKYSDPAKPVRLIEVKCIEEPGLWGFAVSDNGLGIAPEYLEKAFGIFQRVGQNTLDDISGSGIGLATVRRTVEAHGGRAWAESSGVGQGTTFYFTISKKLHSRKTP